jgi:hypothetical protein
MKSYIAVAVPQVCWIFIHTLTNGGVEIEVTPWGRATLISSPWRFPVATV